MEIKYEHVLLRPPMGKRKHCPDLMLRVIHATERNVPQGQVTVFSFGPVLDECSETDGGVVLAAFLEFWPG